MVILFSAHSLPMSVSKNIMLDDPVVEDFEMYDMDSASIRLKPSARRNSKISN